MANNELINGLFQSLLAPQQSGPNPADIMAAMNSKNPMAAAMAINSPSMAQVTKGLLGQFGLTTGTPQEAMQQAVSANPEMLQTAAGMQQLAQMAQQAGDRPTALRLSLMSQEKAKEEADQAKQQGLSATNRGAGVQYLSEMYAGETDEDIRRELSALAPGVAAGTFAADALPDIINDIYERRDKKAPASGGLASAVTKAYLNGTVLQALPNGETVVRTASGAIVPPEQRQQVLQQAAEFERQQAGGVAGAKAAGEAAIDLAGKYYDQATGIEKGISQLEEGIELLGEGATSGRLASLWPSLRQSTLALEQLQREMGLNVIQNTTFGSLSEGELKMALETALPTNLTPPALKEWMLNKKAAQQKLLAYTRNAAGFLYSGGTISDWISQQKEMSALQEAAQEQQPETITFPDGTVIRRVK